MARGFRLGSGVTKLLVPVAVVGAVGFAIWYLMINPSTRILNLGGFLAPPPAAAGPPPMEAPIPVTKEQPYRDTGTFGTGFTPFAGATKEDMDYGSDLEEDYDKINVSS